MTIYCKIESGVVVDRALFDGDMPADWPDATMWRADEEAQIGWLAEGGALVAPPLPEPPPPGAYRVYRSTFVDGLTPDEAATLEMVLAAAEPKLRLMFGAVEYFVSDDPLFAVLHWTVAEALGTTGEPNFARADELLAPP